MSAQDTELDRFKTDISLTDFAQAEFSYELVKEESSANSKVLKLLGDKIIVMRQQDGHDVYFSTADDRDCGTIIDFLQKRISGNLGQVRKELRSWLSTSKKPTIKRPERVPERPMATSKDLADVSKRWVKMTPYRGFYLTNTRRIDQQIIEAFKVRQDDHGNACFAHRNEFGVTGWECKNKGFTGFSSGGQRNVSFTKLDAGPVRGLVVTEAAIDALSYAQMKHENGNCYMSTGGSQLSKQQRELITKIMIKNAGTVTTVVLAMDRDAAGDTMAHELAAMTPRGVETVRDVPNRGKDWNEALLAQWRSGE